MLVRYKSFLVVLVLIFASIYSLPVLYPDNPSLDISSVNSVSSDEEFSNLISSLLKKDSIDYIDIRHSNGSYTVVFASQDLQTIALRKLVDGLPQGYIVALSSVPATPGWLSALGGKPMKLGLDLRGGVHFLLEVDLASLIDQKLLNYSKEIKGWLRNQKIRYRKVELEDGVIIIDLRNDDKDSVLSGLRKKFSELEMLKSNSGSKLKYVFTASEEKEIVDYAIGQNLITLRNRVNELGVSEPVVQRQGKNYITVQLPGVANAADAKRILGSTANLEFRLEADTDTYGLYVPFKNSNRKAFLQRDIIVTGDNVESASASFDENMQPQVNINLDNKGGKLMTRATSSAIGKRMAVIFIEHKLSPKGLDPNTKLKQYIEKSVISFATVQSVLGNQFRITGLDSQQEASRLALLLRSGSLAAPVMIVQERTIGPSLGQQNIEHGINAIVLGFILVMIFILFYYRTFGLIANAALIFNILMITACMSLLGAVLTLPGMAAIVLTVGMAVDANVLIFSRIKEELKKGVQPKVAINSGYDKAFITILDANITTLIAALILFAVGTGAVQGFAITLSLGILTSMFSAIIFTRVCVHLVYGIRSQCNIISIGKY